MEDWVEIVDDAGVTTGAMPRAAARAGKIRYRSVLVVVTTSAGRYVMHRRADHLASMPGRWDTAAGGGVLPGESVVDAARRELAEELGVTVDRCQTLTTGPCDDPHRTWVHVVAAVSDGPFRPDPLEVAEVAEFDRVGLAELAERGVLCPDVAAFVVTPLLATATPSNL